METKWPSTGPDFNNWQSDLKGFMDLLFDAEKDGFWCCDGDLKYLSIRIDTRDNGWLLFVDDPRNPTWKIRVDPQRVADAIAKWREKFPPEPSDPA